MSYQEKTKPCPDCKGKKQVVVDGVTYECSTCKGTGVVTESTPTNESAKIRIND